MASSVGGFITLRALHRPGKRRRASAHSRRASLLHPSCPLNDLPRTKAPNRQTCRDTPTGSTRNTSIMQTNINMPISRATRIFMHHIMQRLRPIPTPLTHQASVTPLASARAAQTGHRVSASVRSGSWGTHGVVALARPSGQALGSSPAALPDPAPGPGALRHD